MLPHVLVELEVLQGQLAVQEATYSSGAAPPERRGVVLREEIENQKQPEDAVTAKSLRVSRRSVADGNDAAFKALLGHSIASYSVAPVAQESASALGNFKGFANLGVGRVASGPAASQQPQTRFNRRSSSYGSSVGGSPLRKSHKSPRKSLRSSLAPSSAPYRRVSDKDKGKKKGVQWRDYAGQGALDDGGEGSAPAAPVVISVTPAEESSSSFSVAAESSARNMSVGGSESEWEDEKTDTSLDFSIFSAHSSSSASASTSSASGVIRAATKRPRASRLDPGFLKSSMTHPELDLSRRDTLFTPPFLVPPGVLPLEHGWPKARSCSGPPSTT